MQPNRPTAPTDTIHVAHRHGTGANGAVTTTRPTAATRVGPAYFEKHAALPRTSRAPARKQRRTLAGLIAAVGRGATW